MLQYLPAGTWMMVRMGALFLVALLWLSLAGCVRREGRNTECKWPGEVADRGAGVPHLSADAEFAEDLAIRYADTHYGLRTPGSGEMYEAERDRCMNLLFQQIAKEHGVPVGVVSGSLGRPTDRASPAALRIGVKPTTSRTTSPKTA